MIRMVAIWARMSVLLVLLLSGAMPARATSVPPIEPIDGPDLVREGSFRNLVEERVDAWTTGGGFLYYARSCESGPDGSVSGTAYIKRRPMGRYSSVTITRQTLTMASYTCNTITGYHGFTSLYADDSGVYYAANAVGVKTIERRTVSAPLSPIVLANYSGYLPEFRGITVSANYVYWLEQNGAAGRMGVAKATDPNPGGRSYMSLGNVTVNEIGQSRGYVFFSTSEGVFRVLYACAVFGDICVERPKIATSGRAFVFRDELPNRYLYVLQGSIVVQLANPTDCTGLCTASALYASPSPWIPTAMTFGTNPATGATALFVKEYEKQTCAGGGFAPGWCDAVIRRAVPFASGPAETIIRLGRPGASGQDALTSNEISGPLENDEAILRFKKGSVATFVSGGFIYNDIDRLSTTAFDAAGIDRDLTFVQKMEITQGTQNLAGVTGNVPLVARRPTVVRVWANQIKGRPTNAPEAILFGERDGKPLEGSPLQSVADPASVATGAPAPDRGVLTSGFAFILPDSWTEGSIKLTANIDPRHIVTDPNLANNILVANASFQKKTAVCIVAMPVRVEDVPTPSINGDGIQSPSFWNALSLFRRIWPTSEVRVYSQSRQIEEREWLFSFGPYEMDEDSSKILTAIGQREDFTDDPDECDDSGAITYYMGLMGGPPSVVKINGAARETALYVVMSDGETEPYAPGGNRPTTPSNVPRAGVTMAHEMGHAAGRQHISCPIQGQPNAPDPSDFLGLDNNYPGTGTAAVCNLDVVGFNSTHGFDIGTMTVISPTEAGDLLSYAHNASPAKARWPSAYTYNALFGAIQNKAEGSGTELLTIAAVPESTPVVVASGVLSPSLGTGEILPAFVAPAGPAGSKLQKKLAESSKPTTSPYRLRLLDINGAELASQPLVLGKPNDGEGGVTQPFNTVFAAPSGTVAKLEVVNGTTVLANLTVGTAQPTVAITAPNGGTAGANLTISFDASDPDATDHLQYTIQYSADGKRWQAIDAGLPGYTPGGSFSLSVPSGELPSSPAARVRVLASDGYHTAIATSNPFVMPNHPPQVAIAAPNGGQPIVAGQTVQLLGESTDVEDGTPSSLTWQVDGKPAGSGNVVSLYGLTTGDHTATLTATDSQGASNSTSRTFRVDPLRIPVISDLPALEGYCDDDGYSAANRVLLEPFAFSGTGRGVVNLARSGNTLFVCFNNLEVGTQTLPPTAYLRLSTATTFYQFGIDRQGTIGTYAGATPGSGTPSAAGSLIGRVRMSDGEAAWSAELRIDVTSLGGWGALKTLHTDESGMTSATETMTWPYGVKSYDPAGWAALNVDGADLAVSMSASIVTPPAGVTVSYSASVVNTGPSAAPTSTLTIALPGSGAATTTSGCTVSGNTVQCALGTLAVGATAQVNVTVTAAGSPGAPFVATATAASGVPDANPPNNTASVAGSIQGRQQNHALGAPDVTQQIYVPIGAVGARPGW